MRSNLKNVFSFAAILISTVSGQYGAVPSSYSSGSFPQPSRQVMVGNGYGNGGMIMRPQYAPVGPTQSNWAMPSSAGASYAMLQRPAYSAPSQIVSPVMQQQTIVNTGPVSPYGNSAAMTQQYAPSSGYSDQQQSAIPIPSSSAWPAAASVPQDQQLAPAPSLSVWSSPSETQQQQSYNGPAAQLAPADQSAQQAEPSYASQSLGPNGPSSYDSNAQQLSMNAGPSNQQFTSVSQQVIAPVQQIVPSGQVYTAQQPAAQQYSNPPAVDASYNPAGQANQQYAGPVVSPMQQQQYSGLQMTAPAAQQQFAPAPASSYDPSTGSSYANLRPRLI